MEQYEIRIDSLGKESEVLTGSELKICNDRRKRAVDE